MWWFLLWYWGKEWSKGDEGKWNENDWSKSKDTSSTKSYTNNTSRNSTTTSTWWETGWNNTSWNSNYDDWRTTTKSNRNGSKNSKTSGKTTSWKTKNCKKEESLIMNPETFPWGHSSHGRVGEITACEVNASKGNLRKSVAPAVVLRIIGVVSFFPLCPCLHQIFLTIERHDRKKIQRQKNFHFEFPFRIVIHL